MGQIGQLQIVRVEGDSRKKGNDPQMMLISAQMKS
jgi:hypothetical protein